MNDLEPSSSTRFQLNKSISWGEIFVGLSMLAAVGTWAALGYEDGQRQLRDFADRAKSLEYRVTSLELALKQQGEDARATAVENRAKLDAISTTLTTVRELVAAQGARGGPTR